MEVINTTKYRYNGQLYDRFEEAAQDWIRHWGIGGGCVSLETEIGEIKGTTREEWEENADGFDGCGSYDQVMHCILSEIEDVEESTEEKAKAEV